MTETVKAIADHQNVKRLNSPVTKRVRERQYENAGFRVLSRIVANICVFSPVDY